MLAWQTVTSFSALILELVLFDPLAGHRESGLAVDATIVFLDGAPRGQASRVTLQEYVFPFEM